MLAPLLTDVITSLDATGAVSVTEGLALRLAKLLPVPPIFDCAWNVLGPSVVPAVTLE